MSGWESLGWLCKGLGIGGFGRDEPRQDLDGGGGLPFVWIGWTMSCLDEKASIGFECTGTVVCVSTRV